MLSLDEDNRHENRVLQYLSERWDANYVLAHQKKDCLTVFYTNQMTGSTGPWPTSKSESGMSQGLNIPQL